jgi:hypothetical protein
VNALLEAVGFCLRDLDAEAAAKAQRGWHW